MSGQGNNGIGAVLGVTTTATGAATLAQTGNGWLAATLVGAAIISASIVIMMARVK
jgi:LPXTG-motif cell wall-anchored protein